MPTHKLGGEVERLFTDAGVTAQVFRGRTADDPDAEGFKMCLDVPAVELALQLGRTVSTSCCKGKHPDTGTDVFCPFYSDCAYQRQIRQRPDVWIGSHELLCSAPGGLGDVAGVFVDEGFWGSALKMGGKGMTLDDLGAAPPLGRNVFQDMDAADVAAWRTQLVAALRLQEGSGGVERRHLVAGGLDVETCSKAHRAEWGLESKVPLWPGMKPEARRRAAEAAGGAVRTRAYAAVWKAARELLEQGDDDAVSGRLVLGETPTDDGFGRRG